MADNDIILPVSCSKLRVWRVERSFLKGILFLGAVYAHPVASLAHEPLEVAADTNGAAQSPAYMPEGSPAMEAPEGRLKAGEALSIQIHSDSNSFLNGAFPIDSKGYVDLPWAGRLFVQGKTPLEVEMILVRKMDYLLKGVPVRVKPALRLAFVGHWVKPGAHYVAADAAIWDAVFSVGGPGLGNQGVVQVMRGGELILQIGLLSDFTKQVTLSNVGIRTGDVLIIPLPSEQPKPSFWTWFKEGLNISVQLVAVGGSLLSAYLTYLVLVERGKI